MTLDQILELVGPLDDSAGENTARDRFRTHLAKSVTAPGALRDYIGPAYALLRRSMSALSRIW